MTKRAESTERTQAENGAGRELVHLVEPMLAGMTTTRQHLLAWVHAHALAARMMQQLLAGVSTRQYDASLEARPSGRRTRGCSKSAVSRTVVRRTRQRLHEQLTRRLEGLEVVPCSWMASWWRSRR